ncbi:GNAT family N-acetyltransferase [Streptomyces siamensis]|uniref:GNAT family N-acetyltransferase n=1 Tax=Streptomyces siamensis TaxID=1274986 RepID=UPI0031E5E187
MTGTFPSIDISTERLFLRPLDEEDIEAFAEMMNDESITAWTSAPQPYTKADAHAWIADLAPAERAQGRGIVFAVTEFLTQRLVGMVHLRNTDWRTRSSEIAIVIAPWARCEGYASEAILGITKWLFHHQKFERLELRTGTDNAAAQQVAQRIGCISEGVLRNAWTARARTADGEWCEVRTDVIVWSLLPEDLPDVHEQLADTGSLTSFTERN